MEQTRKLLTKVASHAAKSERLSGSPCLCYMYNGATVGRNCFAKAMSKCYMIVLHRLSGLHSPVIRRLMTGESNTCPGIPVGPGAWAYLMVSTIIMGMGRAKSD